MLMRNKNLTAIKYPHQGYVVFISSHHVLKQRLHLHLTVTACTRNSRHAQPKTSSLTKLFINRVLLLPAGLPRSGKLPVLFLLSSQKSTFCPLAEKLWSRSKNECTFFDGHDELYHHAKFGENRTTHAGCRCENMVFVFLFVGHAPRLEHRAFEGCIVRTSITLPFVARFRRGFQRFFSERIALLDELHSSHFCR